MTPIIFIISWVVMATITYLLVRWDYRRNNEKWTVGERTKFLLMVPLFWVIVLILFVVMSLDRELKNDRPAKW